MTRPTVEVADIFRAHGNHFIDHHRHWLQFQQLKVMRAITRCRTAALGGHIDQCVQSTCRNGCHDEEGISFNSCLMGSISLWGVGWLNDARSKGRTRVQLSIKICEIWQTGTSEARSVCREDETIPFGGAVERSPQWLRVFR